MKWKTTKKSRAFVKNIIFIFYFSTICRARMKCHFHFLGCYFTKMHGITTAQGNRTLLLGVFLMSFLSRLVFYTFLISFLYFSAKYAVTEL